MKKGKALPIYLLLTLITPWSAFAAEQAEIHIRLCQSFNQEIENKLNLHATPSEREEIALFDTTDLSLHQNHVVIRYRSPSKRQENLTLKIGNLSEDQIPPDWFQINGFKCELDRYLDHDSSACSLKAPLCHGEIDPVFDRTSTIEHIFTHDQLQFFDHYANLTPNWREIRPRRFIQSRQWKLKIPEIRETTEVEEWIVPTSRGTVQLFEISARISRSGSEKTIHDLAAHLNSKGVSICERQQGKVAEAFALD